MPPTELSIYFGASFAKWRRVCSSSSPLELLQKIRRRITSRIFLWYRDALGLAFRLRNVITRNAPITAHARGVAFHIVPEGAIAFHAWSRLRFEQAELEFILRVLRPGMTFFDIGANVGIFSLAAGQKLRRKTGLIYAFEPCPTTFSILEKNLALNHLSEIRAVRTAVSDRTGEAEFFVNARFKDALNSLSDPSHSDAEVVSRESVQTITLDEFIAGAEIPRVDVMKVDVEGAELLVFRGASHLLKRSDAPLILYEGYSWCTAGFHYHPVELMWLLASFGYELFVLDAETGRVRRRRPGESYDAMIVAAKPGHASFSEIARHAREA